MKHPYSIEGMTCTGCVAKVKSKLLALPDVLSAEVQLESPQASISMQQHISLDQLQSALSAAGNYRISALDTTMPAEAGEERTWMQQYKPLLLIFLFITGLSLLAEYNRGYFQTDVWMSNFMQVFS